MKAIFLLANRPSCSYYRCIIPWSAAVVNGVGAVPAVWSPPDRAWGLCRGVWAGVQGTSHNQKHAAAAGKRRRKCFNYRELCCFGRRPVGAAAAGRAD